MDDRPGDRPAHDWRAAVDARLEAIGVPPLRRVEIVEEVSVYLQDRYDELRSCGHTDGDARRIALADLETDRLARELALTEPAAPPEAPPLGSRRSTFMANLWQDLTYAARSLRKAPGFAFVVLATLALGIGANAAVFSVADAVMLRPYPYPDLERIMFLTERTRSGQTLSVAWPTYGDWRTQNRTFEHLGVYRQAAVTLTGGDRPERLNGSLASSEVFAATGIQPVAGRAFGPADDRAGAERVAIVSERLWRSRFNADPSILGRALVLNGDPHVVVGVMPPAMRFPSRQTDVWLSLGPAVPTFPDSHGAHPGLFVVGKLKPGETVERAAADMDTIARRLAAAFPDSNRELAVGMIPYYELIVQNVRPTLQVLLGAVAFVLLIACANLANLMLARSERRQREIAVRRAVGADRRRIVQQLLAESLVMAVLGGALGVVLADWSVRWFVASGPTTIPRIDMVGVDARVVLFAAAVSIATGIVFGLAPAIRASNPDILIALKQGGRGFALSSGRKLRSVLVVAQVSLALTLLVGAGLMARSFARLRAVEPGFDPEGVISMRVQLPAGKYADRTRWIAFHEELVRRVASVPGIALAGLNSALPLEGGGSEAGVIAEGQSLPAPGTPGTVALFQASSPNYLPAMRIPLIQGRYFSDRDTATSLPVVIVDETLVRRLFPNEPPLGKRISFETRGTRENPQPNWREIVGVVSHVRHYGLASGPPYVQVYAPLAQLPVWFEPRRPSMALAVRTALDADTLTGAVRRELAAIDPDVPVYAVQTMQYLVSQNTEQPRLGLLMLAGLGGLALVLAVIGIYGVVSYSVAQRTQEIGVRMALGATRTDVVRLVVGHAMVLVAAGVVVGLGAAFAMSSFVRSMLFQVSERDPATFAAIALILPGVGLIASLLPARRAARVDPIVALRES